MKRRRLLLLGMAAFSIVALLADWSRPGSAQMSVFLYNYAVIHPYARLVRPMTSKFVRCRYVPTCSEYSSEAMRMHGFPRGAWLTVNRLCRCVPWVPLHTPDPVPPP